MQPSKKCIDDINARKVLSVTNGVDGASMATAGQHYEPFVPYVYHQSLIVMDQWIGLPFTVNLRIMRRKSLLKLGCAVNLAGHQHHVFEQIGTAALYDKLDIFLFQQLPVRRRCVNFMLVRQDDFAIQERVGMQKDRHTPSPETLDHSKQTLCMVHMAMAENNAMQILWSYFEHIHIVDEPIGTDTRIEEQASRVVTRMDANQS